MIQSYCTTWSAKWPMYRGLVVLKIKISSSHLQRLCKVVIIPLLHRDVAQFGSVHVWGTWGRRFKSCHLDQLWKRLIASDGVDQPFFIFRYRLVSSGYAWFCPDCPTFYMTMQIHPHREGQDAFVVPVDDTIDWCIEPIPMTKPGVLITMYMGKAERANIGEALRKNFLFLTTKSPHNINTYFATKFAENDGLMHFSRMK